MYVDYNKAMRQVDELNEIADELTRIMNDIGSNKLPILAASWSGSTAAYLYSNKIGLLFPKLVREINYIRDVARGLHNTVRMVQENERSNLNLLNPISGVGEVIVDLFT
jgi:hypothetical protein